MALGNDFSLVLGAKGSRNPSAWGANTFGQLGNASTTNSGAPSDLLGLLSADLLGGALFSGSSAEHARARLGDRLFCWGANVFGEVGDGTTIDRASPVQIFDAKTELSKLGPSTHAVAVGGRHTCAITARGDVLCWGANHRQQLGNSAVTPQRVPLRSF
jgi:alpha-tubulin suppressor-like RCC1 family protein